MKSKISLLLLTYLFFLNSDIHAQWQTLNWPFNTVSLPWLNAVEFSDVNHGISVGENSQYDTGFIIKTENGGDDWDTVHITNAGIFKDVTYLNRSILIAVGLNYQTKEGIISKSIDSGKTWIDIIVSNELLSVFFLNDSIGYCSGSHGSIYKTENAGSLWVHHDLGLTNHISSIYFLNDSTGFACSLDTIMKTTNGGISWTYESVGDTIQPYYLQNIQFTSDSIGYSHSHNDLALFKTIDQGQTWTLSKPNRNGPFNNGMLFTDDSTGYIVGQFSVLKTKDGGNSWTAQQSGPPTNQIFFDDVMDVFFLNQDTGFIAGNSQFYRTYNGGEIITSIARAGTQSHISVYPNPVTDVFSLIIEQEIDEKYILKMFDASGKILAERSIKSNSENQFNVSGLTEGLYLLKLVSNNNYYVQKLLIHN